MAKHVLLAFVAFVVLSSGDVLADVPTTGDLRVSTSTSSESRNASVAGITTEKFVIVWSGPGAADDTGISAQFVDSSGVFLGSEFAVNSYTTGIQSSPAVAATGDGGFIAAWLDASRGILVRGFDSSGAPVAGAALVSGFTNSNNGPILRTNGSGDGVVAWDRIGAGGATSDPGFDCFAHRLDSSGAPLGTEFPVAGYTSGTQASPQVVVTDDGSFLVAWIEESPRNEPGAEADVWARSFDSAGVATTTAFRVNGYTTGYQRVGGIESLVGGRFAITWSGEDQDGDQRGIFGRLLDQAASPDGSEVQVNAFTTGNQTGPAVARTESGFVVSWHGRGLDDDSGAFARRFDADGNAISPDFRVNDRLDGRASAVRWSGLDGGEGLYVFDRWELAEPFTQQFRVDAITRRFCDPLAAVCDRCPDFDDSIDLDSDGVPDGCDRCVNVLGAQNISIKPALSVRYDPHTGTPDKSNKLRFRGEFVLAGLGDVFAGLNPLARGGHFRVEAATGGAIVDVALPAGAAGGRGTVGWRANAKGTKWTFLDQTELSDNGIRKITLSDRSSKGPRRMRVTVRGQGGAYPLDEILIPPRVVVVPGDATDGSASRCGEAIFGSSDCKLRRERLKCRR